MYESFYGLDHRPFSTAPDPAFLYWSEAHLLAFTMMRYAVMTRAPIAVITGEIGAGKTTLLRELLRETEADVRVALVSNMQAGRGELLQWVMMALGERLDAESYVALFDRFQQLVVAEYAAGRRVLLIVDEAQNLSVEQLEELRMLSNINGGKDELLQMILVGQPQLRSILAMPALTQLAQRIGADFHLDPLAAGDVQRYIDHRLERAGGRWRIFTPSAVALIEQVTGGVPRIINTLCDLAMVYGYAAESKVIDRDLLLEFLNGAQSRGLYKQFGAVAPSAGLRLQAT